MRLNLKQLKQIIKEEISRMSLNESWLDITDQQELEDYLASMEGEQTPELVKAVLRSRDPQVKKYFGRSKDDVEDAFSGIEMRPLGGRKFALDDAYGTGQLFTFDGNINTIVSAKAPRVR